MLAKLLTCIFKQNLGTGSLAAKLSGCLPQIDGMKIQNFLALLQFVLSVVNMSPFLRNENVICYHKKMGMMAKQILTHIYLTVTYIQLQSDHSSLHPYV